MPFDPAQSTSSATPANTQAAQHVPEKYLIAFVIQGDDVFKITADNIIHTTGTADGPAFDAIAKLKAAAALLELTNRHKERPEELRKMAKELAGEGMKLMARASSSIRAMPAPEPEAQPEAASEGIQQAEATFQPALQPTPQAAMPIPPAVGPRVVAAASAFAGNSSATPAVERLRPLSPAPLPAPLPSYDDRSTASTALPASSRIALISS